LKKYYTIISILLLGFIFGCKSEMAPKNLKQSQAAITVAELKVRIEQGNPVMVDVRTPAEFNGELGHVPGSFQIPLQELESRLQELEQYKNEEIILICRSGNRSQKATHILLKNDFKALNMLGGMRSWKAAP